MYNNWAQSNGYSTITVDGIAGQKTTRLLFVRTYF